MPWFLPPAYSAYFIAGCVFYLGGQQGYRLFHWIMLALCVVLSVYHVPALVRQFIEVEHAADQWICTAIILCFYVFMFLISVGRLNIKTSSTIVLLGGLSYPLYLTHHMFGRYLIDLLAPIVNAYLLLLGLTILALALAFIIYVVVDKRMAKSLRALLTKLLIRSEPEATAIANN